MTGRAGNSTRPGRGSRAARARERVAGQTGQALPPLLAVHLVELRLARGRFRFAELDGACQRPFYPSVNDPQCDGKRGQEKHEQTVISSPGVVKCRTRYWICFLGGREKLYRAARQWVAGDHAIEVWADDAPVVEAWLRIATCWRSAGWGGPPWLAWADARAVLEMSGILPEDETARRDLMDGLMAMEAGALAEFRSSAGRTD